MKFLAKKVFFISSEKIKFHHFGPPAGKIFLAPLETILPTPMVGALVTYGKMVLPIGVGAGKLLGVLWIFARISLNLPETFCALFAHKFSPTKII